MQNKMIKARKPEPDPARMVDALDLVLDQTHDDENTVREYLLMMRAHFVYRAHVVAE